MPSDVHAEVETDFWDQARILRDRGLSKNGIYRHMAGVPRFRYILHALRLTAPRIRDKLRREHGGPTGSAVHV
eukprot:17050-Eustigmatos_ZCMA.PRE.1